MNTVTAPTVKNEYVHWDKLRHLTPPAGLTMNQWWLAIKLRRSSLARPVPLLDARRQPFTYLLADPIPERLHQIDLAAGGRIQMPEQIMNLHTRDQYYISSLMEEAITSSQLEGAITTRQVAKEMLRTSRPPRDRSETMILNNFQTMKRISDLKGARLTIDVLFELHRIITETTLDDETAAARFRKMEERIVVRDDEHVYHVPPPAGELNRRVVAMCDFANGETPEGFVHPVLRAIILHFWLAYDHPFVDGNGRVARALFYWSMLNSGYWLTEFISISSIVRKQAGQYYRAFMHTETDDSDLTYFVIYHLEVIRRAVEELHAYIARKSAQIQALEKELRATAALNHRQRALIGHAMRHPQFDYTIESHRVSHNVAYETARTDLFGLAESGLLNTRKIGKTWHFAPASDIERRLASLHA